MWLKMPTAQMPHSAGNEGAFHFRQRASWSVNAASRTAQMGRHNNEWVMLRCQVSISNSFLEKNSRTTSESGKTAPSMSDQVMMRRLLIGVEAKRSSPPNAALAIRAPAKPWVMVSIGDVGGLLDHRNKR